MGARGVCSTCHRSTFCRCTKRASKEVEEGLIALYERKLLPLLAEQLEEKLTGLRDVGVRFRLRVALMNKAADTGQRTVNTLAPSFTSSTVQNDLMKAIRSGGAPLESKEHAYVGSEITSPYRLVATGPHGLGGPGSIAVLGDHVLASLNKRLDLLRATDTSYSSKVWKKFRTINATSARDELCVVIESLVSWDLPHLSSEIQTFAKELDTAHRKSATQVSIALPLRLCTFLRVDSNSSVTKAILVGLSSHPPTISKSLKNAFQDQLQGLEDRRGAYNALVGSDFGRAHQAILSHSRPVSRPHFASDSLDRAAIEFVGAVVGSMAKHLNSSGVDSMDSAWKMEPGLSAFSFPLALEKAYIEAGVPEKEALEGLQAMSGEWNTLQEKERAIKAANNADVVQFRARCDRILETIREHLILLPSAQANSRSTLKQTRSDLEAITDDMDDRPFLLNAQSQAMQRVEGLLERQRIHTLPIPHLLDHLEQYATADSGTPMSQRLQTRRTGFFDTVRAKMKHVNDDGVRFENEEIHHAFLQLTVKDRRCVLQGLELPKAGGWDALATKVSASLRPRPPAEVLGMLLVRPALRRDGPWILGNMRDTVNDWYARSSLMLSLAVAHHGEVMWRVLASLSTGCGGGPTTFTDAGPYHVRRALETRNERASFRAIDSSVLDVFMRLSEEVPDLVCTPEDVVALWQVLDRPTASKHPPSHSTNPTRSSKGTGSRPTRAAKSRTFVKPIEVLPALAGRCMSSVRSAAWIADADEFPERLRAMYDAYGPLAESGDLVRWMAAVVDGALALDRFDEAVALVPESHRGDFAFLIDAFLEDSIGHEEATSLFDAFHDRPAAVRRVLEGELRGLVEQTPNLD
jgi:hypothetical protein